MIITFSDNLAWQEYFGKIYIFNEVERNSFILEDIAAIIWNFINLGYCYDEILVKLKSKYKNIQDKEIKTDLNEFLNDMKDTGLVNLYE